MHRCLLGEEVEGCQILHMSNDCFQKMLGTMPNDAENIETCLILSFKVNTYYVLALWFQQESFVAKKPGCSKVTLYNMLRFGVC